MSAEKLDPTPGPRCGEYAGYTAHRRRNERACPPCNRARQDAENERRRKRKAGIMADTREHWDYAGPVPSSIEAFLAEVEYLVQCGEGWGAVCAAFNTNPAALTRRLTKHGRYDLAKHLGITHHQLEGIAA